MKMIGSHPGGGVPTLHGCGVVPQFNPVPMRGTNPAPMRGIYLSIGDAARRWGGGDVRNPTNEGQGTGRRSGAFGFHGLEREMQPHGVGVS